MTPPVEIRQLLAIIDQAYDHPSWHGTNLRGSLRGVSAAAAAWRPAPGRHNVHELVIHAAYWKYVARRRLLGEGGAAFPRKGSNWFAAGNDANESAWRADIALLDDMHRQLRQTVAEIPAAALSRKAAGSKATSFHIVSGIAAHDLYHAGQIQLLKRLRQRSDSR